MVSPKLKAEIDRLQRQIDEIDAAAVLEALQDFVDALEPDHARLLRGIVGKPTVEDLDIDDDELDWLMAGGLPERLLARILALAPKYALPGHQRPFETWRWDFDDSEPGPNGMKPWTPEYRALVALQDELTNEFKPR
jgi:hypothetical protein